MKFKLDPYGLGFCLACLLSSLIAITLIVISLKAIISLFS